MATTNESPSCRKPFANLRLDDEDDDEDAGGAMPSHLTKVAGKKKKACQRRRRRSSARFLKLSQPSDYADEDDEDEEEEAAPESEQLGELYKRAIRMNAENRINAGNSWNLKLIENMDKLTSNENGETVNFTKASCTLDASVKIYSYRVDDVHLTSYKVLANLNRNDAIEKKTNNDKIPASNSSNLLNAGHDHDGNDEENDHDTERTSVRKTADTLETNLANINLSNLDSAYDIDPLFHKMSKTFDEGGAKGLLLVNLGVGPKGCNIVFDSKEEDDEEEKYSDVECTEGMVDITSLTSKLDLLIGTDTLENIELVPQLRTLRHEYAILEKEGFITHPEKKSRRYATSTEEEKEAEMSIHQDFLERSRMSATTARLSTADTAGQPTPATSQNKAAADEDDDDYAADDYGGDDDDDDGDLGFDQFISNDANGDRYSSISFQNDADFDDTQTTKTTTALLNALCSDMTRNDYQFFSQESLDKLGNAWAGASHWKKSVTLAKAAVKKPDTTKRTIAKKRKKFQPVDFEADVSSIPDLLKPAQLNKRGTDPTQLSKAMISKHGKVDNILPLDARMSVDQLYKLFLRPNAIVRPNQKTVNFQEHVDNWDDGSCGGDDVDGPGFELNDDSDDFVVTELSDVRKIDKIQVGYATVAKKVDVKRLKNDLWTELESKIGQKDVDIDVTPEEGDGTSPPEKLSFKETVQEMEMQGQTQTDVTLPFYFICLLHLANEKGLELESRGLHDFFIS